MPYVMEYCLLCTLIIFCIFSTKYAEPELFFSKYKENSGRLLFFFGFVLFILKRRLLY